MKKPVEQQFHVSFRTCHPTNEPPFGKTEACMVAESWDLAGRSSLLLEINIVKCPLDMFCIPQGDTGLSAMIGYVS